jgi:hypothetical protein
MSFDWRAHHARRKLRVRQANLAASERKKTEWRDRMRRRMIFPSPEVSRRRNTTNTPGSLQP